MSALTTLPPKSHVKKVISDQVEIASVVALQGIMQEIAALTQPPPSGKAVARKSNFVDVVTGIVVKLLEDPDAREELRQLLGATEEVDGDKLISSEDAAKMMGFSRPYVNAILDSPEFKGKVIRVNSGHRRVNVSSIRQWMKDHSVRPTPTEEDVALLSEPTDPAFFDEPVLNASERESRRTEIMEGRRQSLKFRPKK